MNIGVIIATSCQFQEKEGSASLESDALTNILQDDKCASERI